MLSLLGDMAGGAVDTFEYQFRWGVMAVCVIAALACLLPGVLLERMRGNYNWFLAAPAGLGLLIAAYAAYPGTTTPKQMKKQADAAALEAAKKHPLRPQLVAKRKQADIALSRSLPAKRKDVDDQRAALRGELRVAIANADFGGWNKVRKAAAIDPTAKSIVDRVTRLAILDTHASYFAQRIDRLEHLSKGLSKVADRLATRPPTTKDSRAGRKLMSMIDAHLTAPAAPTSPPAGSLARTYKALKKQSVVEKPAP